jgi:hypothetical protein
MTTETNGESTSGTEVAQTTVTETSGGSNSTETTQQGTQEETFFDPTSIKGKPELELAYKDMQRAFTEKTSSIAKNKTKVDAYDQFMANPVPVIRQLAQQYGLSIAEATQVANEAQKQFEPQSWDDVMSRAKKEVLQELQPFLSEVKDFKKQSVEKTLDEKCPDWRTYEDKMMENLQSHPSLVKDPEMLYRLSVPQEVLEGRAAQRALQKLQDKAKGSQMSSGSNTNKSGNFIPKGPRTFAESVAIAKAQLAEQGKG